MKKTLSAEDVVTLMKRKQGKRSLRAYARDLGISAAFLCDIYKGRRRPGEKIISQLGIGVTRSVEVEYRYQYQ